MAKSTSKKRRREGPTLEQLAAAEELEAELFGSGLPEEELGKERAEDDTWPPVTGSALAEEPESGPGSDTGDGDAGPSSSGQATEDTLDPAWMVEDRTGSDAVKRTVEVAGRRPAWTDEGDADLQVDISAKSKLRKLRNAEAESVISGVEYEQRLRRQHAKLHRTPGWASLPKQKPVDVDGDEDGGEALLARAGGLLLGADTNRLVAGTLDITRLKDANMHEPSKAVVQSVEFHPNGQLFLTAGMDKKLRFFQVDGVRNPKLQSLHLEDLPIYNAAFAGGGSHVVAAGRRPFFYLHHVEAGRVERVHIRGREERAWERFTTSADPDAPLAAFLGRDGHVPLVSLKSRATVGTLKMGGRVTAARFAAGGRELAVTGADGLVHLWDLRMQHRCFHRHVDEGAVKTSALAVAPGGGLYATGQSAGVVNVYAGWESPKAERGEAVGEPRPPGAVRPLKSVMNLTTEVDTLQFNPDGQILAIASRMKKDSLKLLHLPSCTVFSNWPTGRSPLGYVHSCCFSPNGGLMVVGNAKGRALLYRLHHYDSL